MMTTDKDACNIIVALLQMHGVNDVVISPGSRNAPLVIALTRTSTIRKTVVVDERSAAFVALGMCAATNGASPVAMVCTSGTALLNYAPAIAEAYYRHLPLIVISADRPIEWIDQDDSQTLRQYEALSNYVKKSYNVPSSCSDDNMRWYVNRIVNDALIAAVSERQAPVHINVQLDEPLNAFKEIATIEKNRVVITPDVARSINGATMQDVIINRLIGKKILVVAGFQNDTDQGWVTDDCLTRLIATHGNIVMMTETLANINVDSAIANVDRTLSTMTDWERASMRPDIVITIGGALVSRHIKQYLRQGNLEEHWHVGLTDTTIDCFQALTMRIEMRPREFFEQLQIALTNVDLIAGNEEVENYAQKWLEIADRARLSHDEYVANAVWSDMKAFSVILPKMKGNLHLSNGTPIRYQQLFDKNLNVRSLKCNRGVSGIDGSTSTAVGHAMASLETTILITGDLSAEYDVGALAINNIPSNFKMIVMCNGGGGIFRFINSTSKLPELEQYFVVEPKLPLRQLSEGYGFEYFQADDEASLSAVLDDFLSPMQRPAILAIHTPPVESAEILKGYFNRDKQQSI